MQPQGAFFQLTAREREIVELVAHGYSAKEIGRELGIAPRTGERHIENVRLKMRARNRAHIVTLAVQEGMLRVVPPVPDAQHCAQCLFRPRPAEEEPGPSPADMSTAPRH